MRTPMDRQLWSERGDDSGECRPPGIVVHWWRQPPDGPLPLIRRGCIANTTTIHAKIPSQKDRWDRAEANHRADPHSLKPSREVLFLLTLPQFKNDDAVQYDIFHNRL